KMQLSGDEATGVSIVKKALEEPIKVIAENSGLEGSVVIEKIRQLPEGHGFDAEAMKYGDMVEFGIIDPVKVTRAGLENASSIASMVLTTESLVVEIPEEKKVPAAPPNPYGEY
ncbi:MAG TPA: TCP-1/cpn60 chaperonin family protein, partial [Caldisericia bacterium]|nr:TCP-1/cpn60 chaperonin family protein [Caldisericia bacterium]